MLDWKILAASFAALLFVSTLLVGDFGIPNFFGDIADKLGEWLGNSPFGGMFTAPTSSSVIDSDTINVKIFPDSFVLRPDFPVNITFDKKEIISFSGEITIDYEEKRITLDQSNSQLSIIMPIENIKIHGLKLAKLLIQEKGLDASTGNWEIKTENGSIEIYDFSGIGEITSRSIELDGNITKLIRL